MRRMPCATLGRRISRSRTSWRLTDSPTSATCSRPTPSAVTLVAWTRRGGVGARRGRDSGCDLVGGFGGLLGGGENRPVPPRQPAQGPGRGREEGGAGG